MRQIHDVPILGRSILSRSGSSLVVGVFLAALLILLGGVSSDARAQQPRPPAPLYAMPDSVRTRWVSFENPEAEKGMGAKANQAAKGRAFQTLDPGASVELADIDGSGVIRRIWMTVSERSPTMLRALRLQIFWDEADTAAVDVPLGDFFSAGLGRLTAFENALFSTAEGRSFTAYVPMPFRTHARVVLTNGGEKRAHVFYDLNYTETAELE